MSVMIDERAAEATALPTILSVAQRSQIFLYLGLLGVLLHLGGGAVIGLPLTFLLKNKLHLTASELAYFQLIDAIPLYLAFVFGFARDRFNPIGRGDRGFIMLFGAVNAGLYGAFALAPATYAALLLAVITLRISFLFVASARSGLTATLGQQHVMSGQVSSVWLIFDALVAALLVLAGGQLSEWLEATSADRAAHIVFLVGALIMGMVALYGAWRPRSVFDRLRSERQRAAAPLGDITRLARHWPVYPALLIWLLWEFAPGAGTPLLYYLQNALHATDAQIGQYYATAAVSFIPGFLVFGLLCVRFPLRALLLWGTVVAVPQLVPLLFIHSVAAAFVAAVPYGLLGGFASAAYLALIIRSCPRALQGTTLMLSTTFAVIVERFGNVLGTHLYQSYGGFASSVLATTAVYALILPVLALIPRGLVATADGEPARTESRGLSVQRASA